MRSKPFTPRSQHTIVRVCDVVRNGLGLSSLGSEYMFPKEPKNDRTVAASRIFSEGWRIHIVFYPYFFTLGLIPQLETIVHEHIHVAMQPLDQQLMWVSKAMHRKVVFAREISVDHLSKPLTDLLMPAIKKVL